ncbi:MAG TPA: cytochrome P450 [Streptomyces sp.]|uniref:cytochrome P450 n=1 Tax=Streptomyces sp. TaxID=1931 RepID=UPI002D294698|nr:cytochrome P450 [Streptomyces sp.]HZG05632.1 cytochrome P450 [Streptomyces sp.]
MTTPLPDPDLSRAGFPAGATPPPGCPAHVPDRAKGPGGATRLYGPVASADPMGLYERLRAEHGPVAPVLLEGDVPAWLVLGYDEILQIARNPRRFTRDARHWRDWQEKRIPEDSPLLPVLAWRPDCISQDGREHKRLRGAVKDSLERFDRRAIRRHVHRRAHQLVDDFAGAGRAELLGQFAQLLPMLVLTDLFGLPDAEGARLVEASRQLVKGTEKALVADRRIHDILERLVAEKHRSPGPDLASWLVEHEARLTDEEVLHHLRLVLVLANETTTNLMVNTLRMVLTDPRFRGTLNGGQMTLPAAVEQILWDEPPLTVLPGRFPTYDTEIAGREVRKGDLLLLGLAAGNVDPAIGRTAGEDMHGNRSHLAFNSGPHECPGQDIGRAITGSGIDTLLSRLPDLQLAIPEEELSWTSVSWSRHLDALPVRFTPRHARNPFSRRAAAGPPGASPSSPSPRPSPPSPAAPRPRGGGGAQADAGTAARVATAPAHGRTHGRWWDLLRPWRRG